MILTACSGVYYKCADMQRRLFMALEYYSVYKRAIRIRPDP